MRAPPPRQWPAAGRPAAAAPHGQARPVGCSGFTRAQGMLLGLLTATPCRLGLQAAREALGEQQRGAGPCWRWCKAALGCAFRETAVLRGEPRLALCAAAQPALWHVLRSALCVVLAATCSMYIPRWKASWTGVQGWQRPAVTAC